MAITKFLLEISWSWDNSHHEFGTIAIEDFEMPTGNFENILKPDFPKEDMLWRLKQIFQSLDRSIMGEGKMLRLYRLIETGPMSLENYHNRDKKPIKLEMTLLPICDFDGNGQPIAIKE